MHKMEFKILIDSILMNAKAGVWKGRENEEKNLPCNFSNVTF